MSSLLTKISEIHFKVLKSIKNLKPNSDSSGSSLSHLNPKMSFCFLIKNMNKKT